jgi:hypothetical protein
MTKRFIWLPTVLALMACGVEDTVTRSETAARSTPERSMLTPMPWSKLAPGVWERVREDGIRERSGSGVEGLEYELQRVRGERALLEQVRKVSSKPSAFDARLAESDEYLQVLESAIADVRKNGVLERTPDELPSAQAVYEQGTKSGPFCAGGYSFDVQFSYSMAGGAVSIQGNWSEFAPYAPNKKQFYVRAKAWMENPNDYPIEAQGEWSPAFMNTCCFITNRMSAAAYPTFTPQLEAHGILIGWGGCGTRTYTARNF